MSYNRVSMKMNIIKTTTKDGLILTGIITFPETNTEKIIIHIHGMSGDIYTNSYYPYMYQQYPEAGIAFLAVEHRGTHSITQFNTSEGKIKNIGNTYEKFEESSYDIEAWASKAKELGYKEIWIQSHSLGPSKVAYYIRTNKHSDITGLIWISPSDMIGLVYDSAGIKDHEILLPEAKKLTEEGKGDVILSKDLWGCMKLSASTYVNFFNEGANTAIFNYNKPELGWKVVNSIDLPVLAFTGTKDDGVVPVMDAYKAMEILENELKACPKKKTVVFENAQHDFKEFGQQIVDEVIKFVGDK